MILNPYGGGTIVLENLIRIEAISIRSSDH